MELTARQYLSDPCGASSLPYWKTVGLEVPDGMLIQHDRDFRGECLTDYVDEPYFRLYHDLRGAARRRAAGGLPPVRGHGG